ncbi:Uncharacterised protein [Mycobacteroides abscessus subsp. abscessus]|nr:Uncharacterised protein [Mycobacteroides abscessus subsp. abscessus]
MVAAAYVRHLVLDDCGALPFAEVADSMSGHHRSAVDFTGATGRRLQHPEVTGTATACAPQAPNRHDRDPSQDSEGEQ